MDIGPFDFERPFFKQEQRPLGLNRPLVQPERASYLEHHISRDSAAKIVESDSLRDIEEQLPELLHSDIQDLDINEEPLVHADSNTVVISTKVSDITMTEAKRVDERYESLGMMVKEVKFK